MNGLLRRVVDAHGGLARWRAVTAITAHAQVGGTMWGRKGHPGGLGAVEVRLDPHRQWLSYTPFLTPDHRAGFVPDHTTIEARDGTLIAERHDPRTPLVTGDVQAPWDDLDAAYFSGYAMWNYLTTPFLLTWPGVESAETAPWPQDGETWRRLRALFPPEIATHSREQTFYFDSRDGLLRRHDYNAAVFGGAPTAHYAGVYRTFDGITFPTARRVVPRLPDGTTLAEPVLVSIDLTDVSLTSAPSAHPGG